MAKKAAPKTTTTTDYTGLINGGAFGGATGSAPAGSSGAPSTLASSSPQKVVVPQADQLDPAIANQIMVSGSTGVPAPTGASITASGTLTLPGQSKAQKLLTAYQHMFSGSPAKDMTQGDIDILQTSSNQQLVNAIGQVAVGERKGGQPVERAGGNLAIPSKIMSEWDSLFGGGKKAPVNMNQTKRLVAQEIAKEVPGLKASDILKANPKNVLDIPISTEMAKAMEAQGLYVQTGQPISSAVEKITAGSDAITKAAAGAPASGPLTAQQQYDKLVANYDNATAADKANMITGLGKAGLLENPNNVTGNDVAKAYKTLVTNAVTNKTTVAKAQATLTADLGSNPNLKTAQTSNQAAEIADTADKLGVNLSPEQFDSLSYQASQAQASTGTGWTQAQITQAVAGYFKAPVNADGSVDATQLSGEAASIYQGYQKILDEYQIPMSDGAVMQHVATALTSSIAGINDSGGIDTGAGLSSGTSAASAAFQQYIQQQAASLYPQFATQINQGVTTKTLLDPYAQVAAAVLGYGNAAGTSASVAQSSDAAAALTINWSDPKWAHVLSGNIDAATGRAGPMSLDQARSYFITNPQFGWSSTDDAKNAGIGVADHLLSVFGQPAATGQ